MLRAVLMSPGIAAVRPLLMVRAIFSALAIAISGECGAPCFAQHGAEEPTLGEPDEDDGRRWTLFQWSYGTSFEGGAPLDEPLVSDRPDFTEASTTVGRGVVQFEGGYTYYYDREGGETNASHSYPEALFRIGMFVDWFELRIGQSFTSESGRSAGSPFTNSGPEDLYLGVKIGLTPQEEFLPEMALIPQMTIPTGGDAFTAGETLPGLNWLYGWDINDFLAMGGSSQFNRSIDGGTGAAYVEFAQSWTINYTLSEKLGAYTEWFALIPDGADTEQTQHYLDGGFTYRYTNNLQFDVRAGIGLSQASADYFVGSGLVKRF